MLKEAGILFAITLIAGLLLGFVYELTKGPIRLQEEKAVLRGLELYAKYANRRPHGRYATVYVLTNYATSFREDLHRIYTLRDMNFDPYVMIFNKPSAPQEVRRLQSWCNNRKIFRTQPDFYKYDPKYKR